MRWLNLQKRKKMELLIFKVDFKKAYDSSSWSFLDYILKRFAFDEKWRSWIRACIFAENLLVLVNGIPTEEVAVSLGLYQGDTLAPFCFC